MVLYDPGMRGEGAPGAPTSLTRSSASGLWQALTGPGTGIHPTHPVGRWGMKPGDSSEALCAGSGTAGRLNSTVEVSALSTRGLFLFAQL